MLKQGTFYNELGADFFDRSAKNSHAKRLLARLQNLGYDVQLTPINA